MALTPGVPGVEVPEVMTGNHLSCTVGTQRVQLRLALPEERHRALGEAQTEWDVLQSDYGLP